MKGMRMKKLIVLLAAFVVLAGCVQTVAQPVATTGPVSTTPPTIVRFLASPSTVPPGETSTLQWEITGAASATIDQNVGPVALAGNMAVTPASTTTYTLSATNKYGTTTAQAQVIIRGNATTPGNAPQTYNLPVVAVLKVEPANIVNGQTATLTWEVQNSFDVAISPGLSIIPVKGSREVSPAFTTTYILTTNNDHGSIIATTTLTVSGVQPNEETPVISYFITTPYVIKKGESATLSWKSTGGSSASIDKGVGIVDGSGTKQVTPSETTTYMLTVTNPRGAQFQTVTVNVRG
jgi:hypothetical protein